ncbi:family 14 glycosylhydrolase [Bdellovibrio bacteriovorus]|uniref:family 14 glycosylhydrolase n=1 Tax=Bdellovibrio bacteriovorus TaxID=959 RepID=UPI0021D1262A|nr:family 14 glycosylhydrolase [Bdellovibrio bacteriovorus]UXR64917.1 family 14 glycosylhydrolase [Bdellovibrio bacteriovorus]
MGPLLIGDPYNPDASHSETAWQEFEAQLREAKRSGIEGVSTDIWWGLVEAQKNSFEWRYYEKMADTISRAGLKWIPILSFHQLGGNVGDSGYIPLPEWVWQQGYYKTRSSDPTVLMFKSEHGNVSKEYVSFWATDIMAPHYERFMTAFRANFATRAGLIKEINISMGPAGELRYPSYNMHDGPGAGYPHRGALQAYSELAIQDFQKYVQKKYATIEALNHSWQFNLTHFNQVYPPNPDLLKDQFFRQGEHFSPYGKDFFDWYNDSLTDHAKKMLRIAKGVFHASDSVMTQVELGAKIPGVHWRAGGDRLAELSAGLIRTSYKNWYSDAANFGYHDTLQAFANQGSKVVLHFTASELPDRDYEHDTRIDSRAQTLTRKIGEAARQQGLTLKGENALSWTLYDTNSFVRMNGLLQDHGYSGMTLLRLNEVAGHEQILNQIRGMSQIHSGSLRCGGVFF